jgi:hypothetical protein
MPVKYEVVHESERRQRLCRQSGCFCPPEAMDEPVDLICVWRYQLNVQVWKGDCGFLINSKILIKVQGGSRVRYCPGCGKKMVKETQPNYE